MSGDTVSIAQAVARIDELRAQLDYERGYSRTLVEALKTSDDRARAAESDFETQRERAEAAECRIEELEAELSELRREVPT